MKTPRSFIRTGVPFLAFMVVGSFGLTYFTDVRYWVSRNRRRFAQIDPEKPPKFKTLQQIYEEEISGKSFDDWENVRAPRPWEPETIRSNAEKARKDRQRRTFAKLDQIEERASSLSHEQESTKDKS